MSEPRGESTGALCNHRGVRLRWVLGSLAVMLASPLVAASDGEDVEHPGTASTRDPLAARRAAPVRLAKAAPPAKGGEPKPQPELNISVDCGHDMCVVQQGLDVTVVASRPSPTRAN